MIFILGPLRYAAAIVITLAASVVELLLIFVDRKRGRVFHAVSRLWAKSILGACGVSVNVNGLERLEPGRNYVFVSNHASAFDIPAVVAEIPYQIRIVYKKELERIPFFGWGLKWGSYIGIDRGRGGDAMKTLDEVAARMRAGASVFLYAEGTRTSDGKLQPFKRGAFNLAVRSGIPVVPLTINGSFSLLPKHSVLVRSGTMTLVLGDPILIGEEEGKDAELELMAKVQAAISENYIDQEEITAWR